MNDHPGGWKGRFFEDLGVGDVVEHPLGRNDHACRQHLVYPGYISQTLMATLGWDEVRLPYPVFEGDNVYSRSELLEKRNSKSSENVRIVTVRTGGFNQDATVVISFRPTVMAYLRGKAPRITRLSEV
jgi:hypothetical protein